MKMRSATDLFPLLMAIKELHRELAALSKQIDELKDEMKVLERGGGIQLVITPNRVNDRDADSDCDSVQSAPATVSYDI